MLFHEYQIADMIVAPVAQTPQRRSIADFTYSYYNEDLTVLFKPTDTSLYKWRDYLRPFKWQVWVLLLAATVVTMLVFWWITCLLLSRGKASGDTTMCVLFIFGILVRQGKILKALRDVYLKTFSCLWVIHRNWLSCLP